MQHYFDTNKELWNAKTSYHLASDFYDVEAFKAGKNSLNSTEIADLGDVTGKRILHLQCHFGQDSLSLQRMGAEVTAVDLSDEAIRVARELNDELGLKARFICCNIFDLPEHLDEEFDIVFASYGATPWIPDMNKWMTIASSYLKVGGMLYMIEFHPFIWIYETDFGKLIEYSYFNKGALYFEPKGTYADEEAKINKGEYCWNHSLADIVNAMIQNKIQLEVLGEYDFSHYNVFPKMKEIEKGKWQVEGLEGLIPLMYSVKGRKA